MSDPKDVPIPELTVLKANQLMCADYLRTLAGMVERGQLQAFDVAWTDEIRKPLGKLVIGADVIIAPVEGKFLQQTLKLQQEQKEESTAISFEDITEQLKDHEPCPENERDHCAVCNTKCS